MSRDPSRERVTVGGAGDRATQAPRVTAPSADESTGSVVGTTCNHDVPADSGDAPVAFLAQVPKGEDIPGELYVALALVLALVYGVSDEKSSSQR